MSWCLATSIVPWKSLSLSKWPTGRLVLLSRNVSGAVIQQEQSGCIEADSSSGSFFQIHFNDKLLFQTHDGLSPPPSHMLYLGKQAQRPSISNPTRRPDNGHSSYSAMIIRLIKKAIRRRCDQKGELLQAEWATESREKAEDGKRGLHQRSRVIKHCPSLTRSGFRLPCIT